jgi:hypothetical protein
MATIIPPDVFQGIVLGTLLVLLVLIAQLSYSLARVMRWHVERSEREARISDNREATAAVRHNTVQAKLNTVMADTRTLKLRLFGAGSTR